MGIPPQCKPLRVDGYAAPPPTGPPVTYIDVPVAGSTVSGTVTVSGWAIDNVTAVGTAISSLQVLVDGNIAGNATYGVSRPDVCAVYPSRPGCPKSTSRTS